jgi:hypothetical protein
MDGTQTGVRNLCSLLGNAVGPVIVSSQRTCSFLGKFRHIPSLALSRVHKLMETGKYMSHTDTWYNSHPQYQLPIYYVSKISDESRASKNTHITKVHERITNARRTKGK